MIYFDNAAAMPPDPALPELVAAALERGTFCNQESAHAAGRDTAGMLESCAAALLKSLAPAWADGGKVVFAPSGTDLFELILNSFSWRDGGATCSKLEHPAAQKLVEHANRIAGGGAARLAIYTHVQSELGAFGVRPDFSELTLCDTIQSAGKLPLPVAEADLLTVSGHKLGAPGGAALLLSPTACDRFDFKSARSLEYRVGRAEPLTVALLTDIVVQSVAAMPENLARVSELNSFIRAKLPPKVTATVEFDASSPYILHLRTLGKQGAVVARMLSKAGVMCSASSACQAEAGGPSKALEALGLRGSALYEGLRLSFSPRNTRAEAEEFVAIFKRVLADY